MDGAAISGIPCALRDSPELQRAPTQKEKRRDEDEADFEDQCRACRSVLRAGFLLGGDARGGGSG
jgi:hypothetical protein